LTEFTPARRKADGQQPATVLIVDDSKAIRRILRRALEEAGYLVGEAGNGEECLAACRERRPDLVLLDVDMPVMDGLTTMRELKADPSLESLPVLFLTARTGGLDVAAGLDLGAQDYLRKPCEPAELNARVATALRLKAHELALQEKSHLLESLSATDPLTGLGNRRMLDSRASDLAAEFGSRLPVGLLMADLDLFKRVNDTLGHPAGDAVLRIAASRLTARLPAGATLVRWGGEEFLAICPGLVGDEVAAAGEELRLAVSQTPFSIGTDRPLEVTISVGCAAGPLDDIAALTAAADQALYDAKTTGRNRVCGPNPN
jgi:diguanylate cyclase (GGDEF)-like protein